MDSIQRELAARDTASGVHGEISEYITTKPTTRQIYPPANKVCIIGIYSLHDLFYVHLASLLFQ